MTYNPHYVLAAPSGQAEVATPVPLTCLPVSCSGISVNIQDLAPSCAGFLFGEPLAYPASFLPLPVGYPRWLGCRATGGLLMVSLPTISCLQVWPTLQGPWQVRGGSRPRPRGSLVLWLGQLVHELGLGVKVEHKPQDGPRGSQLCQLSCHLTWVMVGDSQAILP